MKKLRLAVRLFLPIFVIVTIFLPRSAYAFAPASFSAYQAATSTIASQFTIAEAATGTSAGAAATVGAVDLFAAGALIAVGAYMGYVIVGALAGQSEVRVPLTAAQPVPAPAASSTAAVIPASTACLYQVAGGTGTMSTAAAACQTGCTVSGYYGAPTFSSCTSSVTSDTGATSCPGGTYVAACNFQSLASGTMYSINISLYGTPSTSPATCPAGYTLSGSSCVLSDARVASPDKACDYSRSGTTLSQYAGDSVDCSGSALHPAVSASAMTLGGVDGGNNPVLISITPSSSGGSVVQVQRQTTVNGQTQVQTTTITVAPDGTVAGTQTAAQVGTITLDPSTQTGTATTTGPAPAPAPQLQFPTDYARQGEAATAASSIIGADNARLGSAPTAETLPASVVDVSGTNFNTLTFTGSGACPAPKVLHTGLAGDLTVDYTPLCDFAQQFSYAAYVVALFVAALIMTGQRSSDTGG